MYLAVLLFPPSWTMIQNERLPLRRRSLGGNKKKKRETIKKKPKKKEKKQPTATLNKIKTDIKKNQAHLDLKKKKEKKQRKNEKKSKKKREDEFTSTLF